jgi:hypothetical protein
MEPAVTDADELIERAMEVRTLAPEGETPAEGAASSDGG